METIKVFMGMEIGRYDGYEFCKVLKTYANDTKLCWFDHENDDNDEAWDEILIAQQDERFGWYGIDSKPIQVNLGEFKQDWLVKSAEFDR